MSKLLRNISPLGHLDLPLIGRQGESDVPGGDQAGSGCLIPGEVFEVSDEHAGAAPFWRPATAEDNLAHFETRTTAAEAPKEGEEAAPDLVEIFDLGHGLLSQTDNFELVKPKTKKAAAAASTRGD